MQVVLAQEVEAGGGVAVVLVLGRLLRLGLDVELAGEADLLGVVDGHVQERARWSSSRFMLVFHRFW